MRTRKMTMHANPTRMLGLLAGLMLAAPVAAEPDIAWGGELFADNCAECHMVPHNDEWFKARADAGNMGSYDSLRTQVQGCANNFGLPWFDEEVEAVTAWMNQEYYDFE